MIANEAICHTVVLPYCVVPYLAVLIMMGKQHPRGTVLEHSSLQARAF